MAVEPLAKTVDYSRAAFYQIASVEEPEITEERAFYANQLVGYILEGQAKAKETGSTLYVFPAILVDAESMHYRMFGMAPVPPRHRYRPGVLRLTSILPPRCSVTPQSLC